MLQAPRESALTRGAAMPFPHSSPARRPRATRGVLIDWILASTFICIAPSQASSDPTMRFAAPFISYQTSDYSKDFELGDVNRDGRLDVLISTTQGLGSMLGQSDGSLGPVTIVIPGVDGTFELGDVDGDTDLDVAAAMGSSALRVYLNDGSGHFAAGQEYTAPLVDLELVDVNGDHMLDYVFTASRLLTTLLGNGAGGFGPRSDTSTNLDQGGLLEVADATGDGVFDAVMGDHRAAAVFVSRGSGDGTFELPLEYGVGTSTSSQVYAIAVANLSEDGSPDIVVAFRGGGSGGASVLLGNGSGSFAPRVNYLVNSSTRSLAVGEFTGDGHADLVVVSDVTSGLASLLRGVGNGTFLPKVDGPAGLGGLLVEVADINADGYFDAVIVPTSVGHSVDVVYGNGNGLGGGKVLPGGAGAGLRGSVIADYTGDGVADVAYATNITNKIFVRPGVGGGEFGAAIALDSPIAIAGVHPLATGDLNGDGRKDLVEAAWGNSNASPTSSLVVFLGTPVGLAPPTLTPTGTGPHDVALADLNGDGRLDAITANYGGNPSTPPTVPGSTISVLLGNGDGTFASPVPYNVGIGPKALAVGDVNADGFLDVAVCNSGSSSITLLRGNGNGAMGSRIDFPLASAAVSIAFGDFDHDGNVDLAAARTFWISIYPGDGNGAFGSPQDIYTALSPSFSGALFIATVDLNADERDDLVVANQRLQGIVYLHSGPGNVFVAEPLYGTDEVPRDFALGDYDGDGHDDLAVSCSYSISLLRNLHPVNVAVPPLVVPPGSGVSLRLVGAHPTRSQMRFELFLLGRSGGQFEIFDLAGRRMYSRTVESTRTLALPDRALAPGVYLARLRQGSVCANLRFVCVR